MDIESKEFKRLVREIARRNETEPDIVRHVIISEFECARASMGKLSFHGSFVPYILLPYLMTIKIRDGKKKYYLDRFANIEDDVHTEEGESGDRS